MTFYTKMCNWISSYLLLSCLSQIMIVLFFDGLSICMLLCLWAGRMSDINVYVFVWVCEHRGKLYLALLNPLKWTVVLIQSVF